jgi:hypothetical protein
MTNWPCQFVQDSGFAGIRLLKSRFYEIAFCRIKVLRFHVFSVLGFTESRFRRIGFSQITVSRMAVESPIWKNRGFARYIFCWHDKQGFRNQISRIVIFSNQLFPNHVSTHDELALPIRPIFRLCRSQVSQITVLRNCVLPNQGFAGSGFLKLRFPAWP